MAGIAVATIAVKYCKCAPARAPDRIEKEIQMSSDDLLERFLTSKIAQGCTLNTVRWYRMCIGHYLAWVKEGEGEYKKPDTIEDYLARLRRNNLASSTVSGYFTALAAWFTWAYQREYIADNPLRRIQKPKQIKKIKNRVPKGDFAKLLLSIEVRKWSDQRDRCILLIMFYSGLRVTETISLMPTDVDLDEQIISVRRGKGDKPRPVPCHPSLIDELPLYLSMRPPFGSDALFVANDGHDGVRGSLTSGGVRMMLIRRFARAGLTYRNPHAFRHAFAMEFLNAGMEMSAVGAALGHTSVKTTESEYAFWLTSGLKREYSEALKLVG
jgi:site-specific recombinase XerD